MIQQFRRTFSANRGHGSHTKSDVEATFNLADACFRRIAVQLLMLMGDVDAGLWSSYYETFSNTLPPHKTSFSSLSDAREAILELLVQQASPGLKGKPIYETISHASKVEQWGQSFDNLLTELGNSGKSFSAGDKRAIALLQLHRKYLEINVAKYLHGQGDPCFWDRFTTEFDEIVNYAATAAGLDKNYTQRNWANDSPSEAYFHVDIGYTSVLVSVIARCRDPSVRRRAIAVMLAERVQEGVFNGSQSARVGAKVMELEEARSGREVRCSSDIPEEARVRTIRVHLLGPENKKVKMVYGFDKGYWEEEDQQQSLRDSFSRAAYVVFALENKNVHIAQAANCTSDIGSTGAGSDSVPSVNRQLSSSEFGAGKLSAATHCFPDGLLSNSILALSAIAMLLVM
ncbi:hypothetical protein QWA68_009888 [Fusarium oxysporum]|nr:hypothetical protein QWA68_009888 [Fusarium oxysporum]